MLVDRDNCKRVSNLSSVIAITKISGTYAPSLLAMTMM